MSATTTLPPSGPRAYRVEGFIGKGGFGHVYLARPLSDGALLSVALKVLEEDAAEPWVARFFHEARVLASLSDYPCFVRVNAVFRMERRFCIEMEYIPGITLDTLLERVGRLPLPVALHIARQTAMALDAAWSRARDERGELLRVLHRDLKPGNLRLTAAGGVKVLDFGLARSDLRGLRPETLRVLPATLAYMAPERFGFRSDFGHPADVYALGLTLFEMLAGTPFFDLGTINPCLPPDLEALASWTTERLDGLCGDDPALAPLRPLLEQALAVAPEQRCTAAELDAALRRLGGVDLEDEVRLWVEQQLTPLLATLPPPRQDDPWGWSRTVRRSDVERAPAKPTLSPVHETITAPSAVPGGTTLYTLPEETAAPPSAPEPELWEEGPQPREEEASWVGQAVKLSIAAIALSVFTWLAVPKAPEPEPGASTLPTAAMREQKPLPVAPTEPAPEPVAEPAPEPVAEPAPAAATPKVASTSAKLTNKDAATPIVIEQAPLPPAPTGLARMEGAQATSILLVGPGTLTLKPGETRPLPAGAYTATVSFEGGDYPLSVTVREGQTLSFDCTVTRMGSPCQTR